jgi:hypothetical protein
MPEMSAATLAWLLLDAALAGIAVLVLRASYRWVQDREIRSRLFALEGDEGDAMTHLVAIDLVRRNGHRIPWETPQFLCSSGYDYPGLFHKLLSYIPRRLLERGEWLISPGFEGAHAALVYLGAWFLMVQLGTGASARGFAFLVVVGWALTPLLTHNPRRGSVLGERCFGYIWGHAFLFCMVAATVTGEWLWAVPAALAFAMATASSKFALQAMVFVTVVFAALRLDPMPLSILAIGAASAALLSLGYVFTVIAGTLNHSRFYRSFLVRVHDYTRSFSTRDLAQGVSLLLRGRPRAAVAAFKRHPIHRLPALVPWLVPFVVSVIALPGGEMATALIQWVLAALIVTAATATDSFKFLGEAERYMEFALLPMIALSLLLPPPVGPSLLFAAYAYSLIRLIAVYGRSMRVSSAGPETIELARWVASRPASTFLTVPGRLCYPLLYGTPHRAVWWFINAPRGEKLATWKSLFEGGATYPYIAPSALARAREYGAEMIVIDKAGASAAAQAWGLSYDFSLHRTVFENARYIVVEAAVSARAAA